MCFFGCIPRQEIPAEQDGEYSPKRYFVIKQVKQLQCCCNIYPLLYPIVPCLSGSSGDCSRSRWRSRNVTLHRAIYSVEIDCVGRTSIPCVAHPRREHDTNHILDLLLFMKQLHDVGYCSMYLAVKVGRIRFSRTSQNEKCHDSSGRVDLA